MSLVRRLDEVSSDTVALECPRCRTRVSRAHWDLFGDPLMCSECMESGLIPRRAGVCDRFPEEIVAPFTPLPEALMDHAAALGLGSRELLVIWALERHRRTTGDLVFPSIGRLAALTQLGERTVKRSLRQLVELGYVARIAARRSRTARIASNRYDLTPLWEAIAAEAAGSSTGRCDPRGQGQSGRLPQANVARQVDAVEPDASLKTERLTAHELAPAARFGITKEAA